MGMEGGLIGGGVLAAITGGSRTPHHAVQRELGVAQEGWVSESHGVTWSLGPGGRGVGSSGVRTSLPSW